MLEGDAKKRFLEIHKETLLSYHKEAETIINQDKFTKENVERLATIYNICEEYSGDYWDLVDKSVESLKRNMAEIARRKQGVGISFNDVMDKLDKHINKKKP